MFSKEKIREDHIQALFLQVRSEEKCCIKVLTEEDFRTNHQGHVEVT